MNQERARELLPVFQAFAAGADIQCRTDPDAKWYSTINPDWVDDYEYRVRPTPRTVTIAYVPGSAEFPPAIVTNSTVWIREGAKTIEVELPE